MTAEITEISQWGVPGLLIAGLAAYILLIEKRHKEERSEWQKVNERQQDETNRNIRENTSVLSALKALLENRTR